MIQANVTGHKEIKAKLDELGKIGTKALKHATRQTQNIALRQARQNAKTMVGGDLGAKLSKDLKVTRITKNRGSYVKEEIYVKDKPEYIHVSATGNRSYIPWAVEYGHAAPNDPKGLKIVKPIPFIRNAHESTRRKRDDFFAAQIWKSIDKMIAKSKGK